MMQLAVLYSYRVQLENGKLRIIEYSDIIQQLTASDDQDAGSWEYDGIISHRWGKDIRKGKIDLHVKWKGYDEPTWEGTTRSNQARWSDDSCEVDQSLKWRLSVLQDFTKRIDTTKELSVHQTSVDIWCEIRFEKESTTCCWWTYDQS